MKERMMNDRKGQALVEFALALPLLLLLILGVLEFGRAFKIKLVLENAAREGTHYFIYNRFTDADLSGTVDTVVAEAFNSGVAIDPAKVNIVCFMDDNNNGVVDSGEEDTSGWDTYCDGVGDDRATIVVTVTQDFTPALFGSFGTYTIASDSRMLVP